MSGENKIKAAAEKIAGKAKEVVGEVTDNDRLVAEGKAEQTKGDVRNAAEDVKDAFKK